MHKSIPRVGLVALAFAMPLACNSIETEPTGLRTRSAADPHSDIGDITFTITPCDSDMPVVQANEPIDPDQTIPGNIPELQDNPLDGDSEHLFADHFEVLEPGCYNVVAQPNKEDGTPSDVCASAHKDGVEVLEGQTTEIFLLIQCLGSDLGAIDIIAAVNHEPDLDDVEFDDSKFVCGGPGQVCLTGHDVDGDPLEFELLPDGDCQVVPSGPPVGDDPSQGITQCFDVTCSDWGRVDLRGRVYDLAHKEPGTLIRIEDWLAEAGYPNESHGELNFWAYFDGTKYYPDVDGDGYGDANADPMLICEDEDPPPGWVTDNTDCDDTDASINPGAAEICGNGVDENCDGMDQVCDDPIDVSPDVAERLPNGTQAFTVISGAPGPYTWTVNGVIGGDTTYGTIDTDGNYTAPAAVPIPATFDVCAYVTADPGNIDCSSMTISEIPSPGADIVVYNDINMLDDTALANANNVQMLTNLLIYPGAGPRVTGTTFMLEAGHAPVCGGAFCGGTFSALSAQVASDGLTLVTDVSGDISTIDPDVRVIMLWLPTSFYTTPEVNALKQFAAEGGRVIFIGEHSGFYGAGFPAQNDLLTQLGAVMTNVGDLIDCGYNTLPATSLRDHQITTGMTDVTMGCSSEITLGPNDFALYYDSSNTRVLSGVAKIDTTPAAPQPAPVSRVDWEPTHDPLGNRI